MLRINTLLVGLALALAACGGSTAAPVADGSSTSEPVVDETSIDGTATSVADGESADPGESDFAFTPISVMPTEAGPRPLLSWDPVEGADEYYVVVLGSDGTPYWAWSGVDTSINVGGVDDPEGIGAWVGEPMSWSVSALDTDGKVLGLSESADIVP